jgi:hypothetical protein
MTVRVTIAVERGDRRELFGCSCGKSVEQVVPSEKLCIIRSQCFAKQPQLWFSGQVGLIRQLRTAQRTAVRHIAGAFSTTPIDPLHQLMGIMPIDLRLRLLIKTLLSAYAYTESQPAPKLAARVPGPWGPRIRGLTPIPHRSRPYTVQRTFLPLPTSTSLQLHLGTSTLLTPA